MQRSWKCMECGEPVVRRGYGPGREASKFCSGPCRKKFHNRAATRGAHLYHLAMKMRDKREKGGFADLCHQISLYLQQDREDGRQTYFDYDGGPIPYHIPKPEPRGKK